MGILYVIATPIGNMEDITLRAIRILGEADVLASEDTRVTKKIYARHGIHIPQIVFSYHEHNERSGGRRILEALNNNSTVALTSDGGSPGISDPGYRIINEAIETGHQVEVIPGPSAVITAMVASGFPSSSFTFKGFPPRKPGPRKRFLEMDKDLPHTLVIYESPYRVSKLLVDALEVLGNRMAAVCSELTKKFERVRRGSIQDLITQFHGKKIKGEVTIVIAGNHPKFLRDVEDDSEDES
jgi:16S rRNA (cytidine1402-2'-O)-methyltransferase